MKLLTEVNNGRLAMIGLFGLLSEGKVPGSVPLLKGVIPFYAGEPMAPLASRSTKPPYAAKASSAEVVTERKAMRDSRLSSAMPSSG